MLIGDKNLLKFNVKIWYYKTMKSKGQIKFHEFNTFNICHYLLTFLKT